MAVGTEIYVWANSMLLGLGLGGGFAAVWSRSQVGAMPLKDVKT
jgi:hypothetical protein